MLAVFALIAFACIQGCRAASGNALPAGVSPGGNSSDLSITLSDGDVRKYLLHIPKNYDSNEPTGLLFVYNGRGSDNAHTESFTKFSQRNYNPDWIVVYPQGTSDQKDEDVWQGDPNADADDVGFTLELLDDLLDTYAIDQSRIYAAGMSNGGGFVGNYLACDPDASKRFAAYGAVSAAYYQFTDASRRRCDGDTVDITCDNGGTKVALLDIHGGNDDTIPYAGGYRRSACLPSVPHFVASWAERNGMDTANQTSKVDHGHATHYTFGEGEAEGMVQSYYVPTLSHAWASGSNGEVLKATDVLMDFFNEWTFEKGQRAADTLPNTTSSGGKKGGGKHSGASDGFHLDAWLLALALSTGPVFLDFW